MGIKRHIFKKKRAVLALVVGALIIIINALAWSSTAFCDCYIRNVFPIWVNTYGRLTNLFSISVGEIMLIAGVIAVAGFCFIAMMDLVWIIVCFVNRRCRKTADTTGREQIAVGQGILPTVTAIYARCLGWLLLATGLIMTLNCTVLYHASTFSDAYYMEDGQEDTLEQLVKVYNEVAQKCNELSAVIRRDEQGYALYMGAGEGNRGSEVYDRALEQMAGEAVQQMQNLGQSYDNLDGWYPNPKALTFSDFMCQQHMQGYYFPFSMEANYNGVMNPVRIPATMCHELAHLRGYIYEDEANFIGYLACIQSDDDYIRYSGYMSVLNYLYGDLYDSYRWDRDSFVKVVEKHPLRKLSDDVLADNYFVSDKEWDRINREAVVDTDTVSQAADTFVEANLKANGIKEGKIAYSKVVHLLLLYDRNSGWNKVK